MTGTAAASPKDLATIDRESLTNSTGLPYREFRAKLTPRFGIVWRDIALCYLALCAIAAGVLMLAERWPLLAIVVGAPLFGYAVEALHLFIHEAGHYNLAPSRRLNDMLANIFIGALIGLDVRDYRPVHFDHHRYLGQPNDPEHSYFSALNWRFPLEIVTGLRAVRVFTRKVHALRSPASDAAAADNGRPRTHRAMAIVGVTLHASFLAALVAMGRWPLAAAWTLGMLVFFPFLASLRQVLEHRDEDADTSIAYDTVPHGAVNRLFGTGPLASTLGSAGFNRHLLHHLEPQISYTRFAELEAYLRDTQYAPILEARTTTYAKTLRRLLAT